MAVTLEQSTGTHSIPESTRPSRPNENNMTPQLVSYGISPMDGTPSHPIITTSQSTLIQKLDTRGKAYKSWSVPRKYVFAAPILGLAVSSNPSNASESRNYLYALISSAPDVSLKEKEQWIYFWQEEDGFECLLKKKLEFRVKQVLAVGQRLVLVGLNGEVLYADHELSSLASVGISCSDKESTVAWCLANENSVCVVLSRCGALEKLILIEIDASSDSMNIKSELSLGSFQIQDSESFAYDFQKQKFSVICAAGNNERGCAWKNFAINQQTAVLTRTVPLIEGTHQIKSVGLSHVAMVSSPKGSVAPTLTIWDTDYGVMHAKQVIEDAKSCSDIQIELMELETSCFLLVRCGTSVNWFPFLVKQASLLDAMQRFNMKQNLVNVKPASLMNPFIDRIHKSDSANALDAVFDDFVSSSSKAHVFDFGLGDEDVDADEVTLDAEVVKAFVDKCIASPKAFSEHVMKSLLERRALSSNMVKNGGLVCALLSRQQFHLVFLALHQLGDISESQVIRVLQGFFSDVSEHELKAYTDNNPDLQECLVKGKFQSATDMFMQAILSTPVTPAFLARPLLTLTPSQIQSLLTYLLARLQSRDLIEAPEVSYPRRLSSQQVINLASVMVDSNATSLIMTEQFHELVFQLRLLVVQSVRECHEMETLSGILKDVYHVDDLEYLDARIKYAEGSKRKKQHKKKSQVIQTRFHKEVDRVIGLYGIERVQWW